MTERWTLLARRREWLETRTPDEFSGWAARQRSTVFRHHYFNRINSAYRRRCQDAGVDESLPNWADLPVVDKRFLAAADYATQPAWTGRVVLTSTSGTTSTAVTVPHTTRSARTGLGDNFLRALLHAGARGDDRHWGIQHQLGRGSVTGSELSMRSLRACAGTNALITATHSALEQQIMDAVRLDPWSVSSSPGFLTRVALEAGPEPRIRPRVVLFGGAPLDDGARTHIEGYFRPDRIVGFFPTTDAGALGVAVTGDGVYETFSLTHWIEVLDSNGAHVEEGETGQLVVTSYDNFAAPLIRYRVGDTVRYLGWRSNRLLLSEITRTAEARLGATLLPLKDLAGWTHRLQRVDAQVVGVQLVRRPTAEGIDQPVLRVVAPHLDQRLKQAALALLDDFPQVLHQIATGEVHPAQVEHAHPSSAMKGIFKLASFIDESHKPQAHHLEGAQ